jgi:hypothetical protein
MKVNYRWARWGILALFLVLCLATANYNGPFFDEGIFVTAGVRMLEPTAYRDGFLTWFAGSMVWPGLAALGYRAGGLIGTRVAAILLAAITLAAFGQAARNIFGQKAGFWATLALALSGPFVALSRLGVYDVPALAGIAVSFWAITELARRDHRGWLVGAVVAYVFAIFAKYPTGLMIVPLLGVLLLLRREKATTDVMIFLFLAGAIGLIFFLPAREQIGTFFNWRLQNRPVFGASVSVIGFVLLYLSAAPLILGLVGWWASKRYPAFGLLLLLSLGIWPIYHLLTGDPVGTNKHIVFGFLFAYPLVGVALSKLWGDDQPRAWLRKAAALVLVLGLGGLGLIQVNQSDQSWPDLRAPAGVLQSAVTPGDQLLINESWPFTMVLYTAGRIDSPWDVYDTYRITHEEDAPDLCAYDWVVDVQGSYAWPSEIRETLEQCETYHPFYRHTSMVINLGADFNYVRYPVETVVWRNNMERTQHE